MSPKSRLLVTPSGPYHYPQIPNHWYIITARKRSLRRLCFYTCQSFCSQAGVYPSMQWANSIHLPWADTPRDTVNVRAVRILLECILRVATFQPRWNSLCFPWVFPVLDTFSLCYFYVKNSSWINESLANSIVTALSYTEACKIIFQSEDNLLLKYCKCL